MLVVVAAVGAYAFNGGFDDRGRSDDGTSAVPGDPSSSSDDLTAAGPPSSEGGPISPGGGGSGGGGEHTLPDLPGDDDNGAGSGDSGSGSNGPVVPTGPSGGGSNGQPDGGSDVPPSGSGSSSPPAATNHIYGGPRVNGFYTGGVPVWAGHDPDRGAKISGSGLRTGTGYAISVDADVTDHGLQWFKDGATPVNSNNDPAGPIKEWMAVDTSIGMFLEIHSDRPIGADDVSASGVWGKQLVLGSPGESGPGLRSVEQVDPCTVRVFLAYQPYTASSSAGGFQGPISLASGNGSIEEFNDKGALAAYAPLKILFNTPGNYDLSFYLAKSGGGGAVEHVSPTTTVPVLVAGKA